MHAVHRYSTKPFPAYRYLPFQAGMPHPRNDPDGHSHGLEEDYLPRFSATEWAACQPYLYGVDLFNHGYWWEAHEAWEQVWLAAGRTTMEGLFVQGLIQVAAGQLKRAMDEWHGAALLTESGIGKLTPAGESFLGIELHPFIAEIRASLKSGDQMPPLIRLCPAPA